MYHSQPNILRVCIDEAGRWPLAGPVMVWCTCSLQHFDTSAYKDSKVLNKKKRETLYTRIQQDEATGHCIAATGYASATYIDQKGIIAALHHACCKAMFALCKKLFINHRHEKLLNSVHGEDHIAAYALTNLFKKKYINAKLINTILSYPNTIYSRWAILIDGNHTFHLDRYLTPKIITIIKGDSKNPLISMASIVAKVERDRYMDRLWQRMPLYMFEKHKWYGTKEHRTALTKYGKSIVHRQSFCKAYPKQYMPQKKLSLPRPLLHINNIDDNRKDLPQHKPKLLLHICCAPDLTWPLHRLKHHFKLYLFRYNPNIHPRKEHSKRYDQFLKLIWLEHGDYEILEDRYDPKEFFDAMMEEREDIDPKLKHATKKAVLAQAGAMEEWSSRCNPCYSMRLAQAAKNAAKHDIPYFTSTLLISPKKKMDKLYRRWKEGEKMYPRTKFLRFDFIKNQWYNKASILTKKHKLRRQNYCGCGRTIPKPWEKSQSYTWW